jgi:hypothetical protein
VGERRSAYRVLVGKPEETLEHLGVDRRIVLKWILHKSIRRTWIGLVWLRKGANGGICECSNRTPGSIK